MKTEARLTLYLMIAALALMVWMNRYAYMSFGVYPVRVNRLTGDTKVFYNGRWAYWK